MNIHTKYNKGFTLIEMLITVAIVSILASIALPSFSKLIERNRITTATNELVSNLLLTKSEALKRSNSVTLCPSTNQSTCSENKDYSAGWIIYLDCGDIGKRVTTKIDDCGPNEKEDIIKVGDSLDAVNLENNVRNHITFNYTGRPAGVSTFSIGKSADAITKTISINLVGRVKVKDAEVEEE